MFPIQKVTSLDLAFGGDVKRLMPTWDQCREHRHGAWAQLVSDWFFQGVPNLNTVPKQGVDEKAALAHIAAIMRSWEPKHEHKEAACAFLFAEWFESATWGDGKSAP